MQSHLPTHQTDLMNPHAIVLKIHSQSLIVPPSANFIEALILVAKLSQMITPIRWWW